MRRNVLPILGSEQVDAFAIDADDHLVGKNAVVHRLARRIKGGSIEFEAPDDLEILLPGVVRRHALVERMLLQDHLLPIVRFSLREHQLRDKIFQ